MGRSFAAGDEGPLALELLGDPGRLGEVAALELSVAANRRVEIPVIDVQLPPGVEARGALLDTVQAASGVRRAEARYPGFLRIWLSPLSEGTQVAIPLPFRWTVSGTVRGLGAMAYPEAAPQDLTVLPPRVMNIE